jgi:hypothetical protein
MIGMAMQNAAPTLRWVQQGDAPLPEHSVNPCLAVGARNTAVGGEPAVQDTETTVLVRCPAVRDTAFTARELSPLGHPG